MNPTEVYLRAFDLCNQSARPAKVITYKSGPNKGKTKNQTARLAKIGMLGIAEQTLWLWVRQGKFPQPIKLSTGITVWKASDVQTFLDEREALSKGSAA